MKILFVGIDVASQTHVMACLDESGKILLKNKTFPNTLPGAEEIEKTLLALAEKGNFQEIKIGVEATAFYDWHLADFLASNSALALLSVKLYRLNPLRVFRFRKSADEVDKTDNVDAQVIADFLRHGRNLPEPFAGGNPYLPLQRLTRYRFHIIGTLVRETSHALMHLFMKFSVLAQDNPLRHLTSATCQALMEEFFSPEEILKTSLEELTRFLVEHGKNRFPFPEAMAAKIQQAARESYRLRPELARSEHLILSNLLRNIRAIKESVKPIDQAIAEEIEQFPHTLQSLPGVGPVYSAGILAELGDIGRFSSDDAVAKMAGLVWSRHQSGRFEAEDRRMIRSGNKYLRYYLVEAANALRMHDATFRSYYEHKFKEVPKHKHKRALVLTARKLVRLVYALLKRGQIYRRQQTLNPAEINQPAEVTLAHQDPV